MKNLLKFIAVLFISNLSAQNNDFKQLNISEQQLKAHQLTLPNVADMAPLSNLDLNPTETYEIKQVILKNFAPPTMGLTPAFDANYFGPIVHSLLKDKVMGYAYQIYQGNNAIYTGLWNWAKSPADGNKGWTVDTRMHIASSSKLLTTIGLVKLLDKKGILVDAPIINYLPTYWKKGNGIANVTFRQLLTHTSGLSTGNSACDYAAMKQVIGTSPNAAAGTYANVNFSLMRVLITILDGRLAANTTYGLDGPLLDNLWDIVATKYFQDYMNQQVFALAGVPTIGFTPQVGVPTAKAYLSMTSTQGRDGDWSTVSGSDGFYMSVAQVLKTLACFRNGTIMPTNRAKYILDNDLGITKTYTTLAGKIDMQRGQWHINGGEEQTVIYCLPNNVNIALFINSPIKGYENKHLSDLIYPIIEQSIH